MAVNKSLKKISTVSPTSTSSGNTYSTYQDVANSTTPTSTLKNTAKYTADNTKTQNPTSPVAAATTTTTNTTTPTTTTPTLNKSLNLNKNANFVSGLDSSNSTEGTLTEKHTDTPAATEGGSDDGVEEPATVVEEPVNENAGAEEVNEGGDDGTGGETKNSYQDYLDIANGATYNDVTGASSAYNAKNKAESYYNTLLDAYNNNQAGMSNYERAAANSQLAAALSNMNSAETYYNTYLENANAASQSKSAQYTAQQNALKYLQNSLANSGLASQGVAESTKAGLLNTAATNNANIDTNLASNQNSAYQTYQNAVNSNDATARQNANDYLIAGQQYADSRTDADRTYELNKTSAENSQANTEKSLAMQQQQIDNSQATTDQTNLASTQNDNYTIAYNEIANASTRAEAEEILNGLEGDQLSTLGRYQLQTLIDSTFNETTTDEEGNTTGGEKIVNPLDAVSNNTVYEDLDELRDEGFYYNGSNKIKDADRKYISAAWNAFTKQATAGAYAVGDAVDISQAGGGNATRHMYVVRTESGWANLTQEQYNDYTGTKKECKA